MKKRFYSTLYYKMSKISLKKPEPHFPFSFKYFFINSTRVVFEGSLSVVLHHLVVALSECSSRLVESCRERDAVATRCNVECTFFGNMASASADEALDRNVVCKLNDWNKRYQTL